MKILHSRKWWAVALVTGALVFQALPTGCAEYYATSALSSFDFCSVFNCTGGSYFDLCNPVPLFWDCPQLVATGTS